MKENKLMTTKNVVLMGMFGALAGVLMVFEIPLPFLAPSFYGLDISEVPVLVGTFALGPVAGAVIEVVKILVKLVLKPTSTGFVGELANLTFGCAMVIPAGLIYQFKKTRKRRYGSSDSRNPSHVSCSNRGKCVGYAAFLFQFYAIGKYHCGRGGY